MATMERGLRERIERDPEAEYDVIVRTSGESEPVARFCAHSGMTIHREFKLVPGLAVTGKGRDLLTLAENPRVLSIEADREVRVQ